MVKLIREDPFALPPCKLPAETQEARDVAENIWEKGYWQLALGLIAKFFFEIYRYYEHNCRRRTLQSPELFEWAKEFRILEETVKGHLKRILTVGPALIEAYRKSRATQKLEILDLPAFCYDINLNSWTSLMHQRRFDILRETRILSSSNLTNAGLQLLRTSGMRHTYKGYSHIGEDLSEASEKEHYWRTTWAAKKFTPPIDRSFANALKRILETIEDINARFNKGTLYVNPILADLSVAPIPPQNGTQVNAVSTSITLTPMNSSHSTLQISTTRPPYRPTPQTDGLWKYDRGNTPNGLEDAQWIRAFNNADSKAGKTIDDRRIHRENGDTRTEAIRALKEKGMLPADYVDSNW